jgi:hypothetical protein
MVKSAKKTTSPSKAQTRNQTNLNTIQLVKEEMSPYLGEKKNPWQETSEATTWMLLSQYNIQDRDIINTTFMALADPKNYNRKPSFTNKFGNIKTSLKELEPFQMLFKEKIRSYMFSKENITAMFSNLEKLGRVPNVVLQALILESAISLTKKKPAGLKMKIPGGSSQGLSWVNVKKRLNFLLFISQELYHRSKSFQEVECKKVAKMHKDLLKIVADY